MSAQDVIQNDDRSAGLILVNGISKVTVKQNLGMVAITHTFKHTAKIYHKDNRTRIIFEIHPSSDVRSVPVATVGSWPTISDINQPFQDIFSSGVSRKAYAEIQQTLAKELRSTVTEYKKYMRSSSVMDDEW